MQFASPTSRFLPQERTLAEVPRFRVEEVTLADVPATLIMNEELLQ
jgi:hypothetical protein